MATPPQQVSFSAFGRQPLHELLGLSLDVPAGTRDDLRQLAYLEKYLRSLGCHTILIERHYVDRDYIEDHSLFYSRSLVAFDNYCRRLHFFSCRPRETQREIRRLQRIGESDGEGELESAAADFARRAYLGFSIIKPLPRTPVGRTVLRSYPATVEDGFTRSFDSIRDYKVHLFGIELPLIGLPFQQQDVGVSACATVALWSSLQKFKSFEDIGPATPAQITLLASKYSLPFGRALPSEGLSTDQMCQSVQALGVSPILNRTNDSASARLHLYSAARSGLAPVLILESCVDPDSAHAVTVAGIKTRPLAIAPLIAEGIRDRSSELVALYVHDDRWGPYLRADLDDTLSTSLVLSIDIEPSESWRLTHLLVPSHPKIRLSISNLADICLSLVTAFDDLKRKTLSGTARADPNTVTTFDYRIVRSYRYLGSYVTGTDTLRSEAATKMYRSLAMPRYLGVVRLSTPRLGTLEVLVDTTSTMRNVNFVCVVGIGKTAPQLVAIGHELAKFFGCTFVT